MVLVWGDGMAFACRLPGASPTEDVQFWNGPLLKKGYEVVPLPVSFMLVFT